MDHAPSLPVDRGGVPVTPPPGLSKEQLAEMVRLERETRHLSIPQLRERFGADWPREIARIREEADAVFDAYTAALAASDQARERAEQALREILIRIEDANQKHRKGGAANQ